MSKSTYPSLYGKDRFHTVLESDMPYIEWRAPIIVTDPESSHSRLGCRYCIAGYGLRGRDSFKSEYVFDSPDEFGVHMAGQHPYAAISKGVSNVNQ